MNLSVIGADEDIENILKDLGEAFLKVEEEAEEILKELVEVFSSVDICNTTIHSEVGGLHRGLFVYDGQTSHSENKSYIDNRGKQRSISNISFYRLRL